jgi:hypothetical protein
MKAFKLIFGSTFNFYGKRAIIPKLNQDIPETELKWRIRVCLNYHNVKHLPTIGL